MISPMLYLKFAKDIEPEIFENKTPKFHLEIIDFINKDSSHKAVAIFRGAAKTTLLNKIYTVSQIFFKTEPFIMIASSNEAKVLSFLESVKNSCDRASEKGYALTRGKIWNKDKIEVVVNAGLKDKNGNSIQKSCYVCALSAGQDPRGAIINNTRPTLIIVDDLESKVGAFSVYNKENRRKLRSWFYADLLPALHPSKGKLLIVGTIIHEDSILNNIINGDNEEGIQWDRIKIPIIKDGISTWSSRFSLQKIEKIKSTLEKQGLVHEFYQEYMCAPINPEKALFKKEYFKYFDCLEYNRLRVPITVVITDGVNQKEVKTFSASVINMGNEKISLNECEIFSTIDLASSSGRDETAIITFAVDKQERIFIIDVVSGHWTPFEKSVEIIKVFLSFNPSRIGIEKAGMQNDFFYTIDVIQKLTGIVLPIEALTHGGKAKNTRISNLEPYYRTGWIYHNCALSSINELEAQLLAFDPEVDSKIDDIIDATAYMMHYVNNRFFNKEYEDYEYELPTQSWV